MKKLLIIEILVFVLLIGVTVCIFTGVFNRAEAPRETIPTEETLPQFGFQLVVPAMPKATWQTFPDRELTCKGFFV